MEIPHLCIFLEGTVYFWMAWCYGKKKDCLKEEEYYRKSLEALPVGENTLNNLGYSLYKQRKFKEAQSVFEGLPAAESRCALCRK